MALIQFGAIVTNIAGKIGGQIFGGSQNGATLRNQVRNKKLWGFASISGTGNGQSPQTNVSIISQSWKDLTDAQRLAWTSYAVQYYTTRNLYGVHSLSGYACYSKLNHNLLLCGVPIITDPVPKTTLTDPGTCSISALSPTVFTVAYTNSLNPDEYFLISATGTNTVTLSIQKKGFKIIRNASSSVANPIDIYNYYLNIKGAPLSGGWITVKVEVINVVTGQRGMSRSTSHQVA